MGVRRKEGGIGPLRHRPRRSSSASIYLPSPHFQVSESEVAQELASAGVRTETTTRLDLGTGYALEIYRAGPEPRLFPGFRPRALFLAAAFLTRMGLAHEAFAFAAGGQRGSRAAERFGRQINARYFMVISGLVKPPLANTRGFFAALHQGPCLPAAGAARPDPTSNPSPHLCCFSASRSFILSDSLIEDLPPDFPSRETKEEPRDYSKGLSPGKEVPRPRAPAVGRAFSSPPREVARTSAPPPRRTPPKSQAAPQEFGRGPGTLRAAGRRSPKPAASGRGGLWGLQVRRRRGPASPWLARPPLPGIAPSAPGRRR